MIGQFFGDVLDDSGKKLGFSVTFLDPDRDVGHALYQAEEMNPPGMRVAKLSVKLEEGGRLKVTVGSHPEY